MIYSGENRHVLILQDKRYRKLLSEIESLEKDRIFCKHDLSHFMDVSRIAAIIWLEDGAAHDLTRDVIYASGLMHDIGRAEEYKNGISHDIASSDISKSILPNLGYSPAEVAKISRAILGHRGRKPAKDDYLGEILKRADRLSRACFTCDASDKCKWSEADRNEVLIY